MSGSSAGKMTGSHGDADQRRRRDPRRILSEDQGFAISGMFYCGSAAARLEASGLTVTLKLKNELGVGSAGGGRGGALRMSPRRPVLPTH